jgi:hypothetical protein
MAKQYELEWCKCKTTSVFTNHSSGGGGSGSSTYKQQKCTKVKMEHATNKTKPAHITIYMKYWNKSPHS